MARVRINHAEAFRYSRQVSEKHIRRALLDMKLEAIRALTVGPYTHGHLALDLKEEVHLSPKGVEGSLGSHLPYAASVEKGAEAHYIFPRPPKTKLKFYWRKVGRVVSPPFVYHPGQKGKGYLRHSLAKVGPRYNMLVFIYE